MAADHHRNSRPMTHVRWIGGSPGSGKSTVTRALAERHGLRAYYYDWHERGHLTRCLQHPATDPALTAWLNLTPDERWLHPSPTELADNTIASWTTRFPLVLDDLTAYPAGTTILVEGPGPFPALVYPLLADPRHAVYLVPTPELIRTVRTTRHQRGQSAASSTSDPPRALDNIIARDIFLADRIRTEARRLGLTVLTIDGASPIDEITAVVAHHFGLIPPRPPHRRPRRSRRRIPRRPPHPPLRRPRHPPPPRTARRPPLPHRLRPLCRRIGPFRSQAGRRGRHDWDRELAR